MERFKSISQDVNDNHKDYNWMNINYIYIMKKCAPPIIKPVT